MSALTTNVKLDQQFVGTHIVQTRRIRAGSAAADTLVPGMKVGRVEGLAPGEAVTITKGVLSDTLTFTGMGAGPYTDRTIRIYDNNDTI